MNCVRCHGDFKIEIHHKKHRIDGGTNEPHNLEPLCRHCHKFIHAEAILLGHIAKWTRRLESLRERNSSQTIRETGYQSYSLEA